MALDMDDGFANRGAEVGRLRRVDLADRLGIDLEREQIGADLVMQVAGDFGALFFLGVLQLRVKLAVGAAKRPTVARPCD